MANTNQNRENNQANSTRKTRKRKKAKFNWFVYIAVVLATSAALAGVGWLLACDLCAFNNPYATATVEITAEDDMKSISNKLEDAGLIEYKWFFRLFGKVADADEKIGIGTYTLNTDMDYRAIITGMHNSSGNLNADTVTVTIPEGYTVAQALQLMASKGVNTLGNLTEAAQTYNFDYAFIDNDREDINRLEGFMFPDTYEFYIGEKGSSAISRLIKNFVAKISEYEEAIDASPYSIEELITIASLIEKETDGSDHAMIASVIYNRLNDTGAGGTYKLLQIDAALLYGIPGAHNGITNEHKKVDSPYNLYKYAGLPPTPIANPGMESIEAALSPASTGYYYYALGKSGKHSFFSNYNDHVNFINSGEYGG